MLKFFPTLVFYLSLSTVLSACNEPQGNKQANITISPISATTPDIDSTYQDLIGSPIELSDFRNKKILLNYWATWCAPCIRELPALSRASTILNEDDFVVLMASDESLETIAEFINENNFEGNFIKLNSFFASHGVEAVPSTVLYSADGEILNTWLGEYEWDSPEIIAQLQEMASAL